MNEHELGIIALAVPVLNMHLGIIAALNCIGSTPYMTEQYLMQRIFLLLKEVAQQLRSIL